MTISRIVFEKGISIRHAEEPAGNRWILESAESQQSVESPASVTQEYGVRPVVVTKSLGCDDETALLLLLNALPVHRWFYAFFQTFFEHDLSLCQFKEGLDYILGAAIHHCVNLARLYGHVCRLFVKSTPFGQLHSDEMGFVSIGHAADPERIYHELDALITAVRRAYGTTRYLLWHEFGPQKGSVPSSFEKTYPQCDRLPTALRQRLDTSWSEFGAGMTVYRDCLQHYVHLSPQFPFAQMQKLEGAVWSTTFWIPDNPEAKSMQNFRFHNRIDALTYGWELVNEVLELAKAIAKEIQRTIAA